MAGDLAVGIDTDFVVPAGGTTELTIGSLVGKHNGGLTDGAEERW